MISTAAFQLQVNRHMNATEWLINNTYGWWLDNSDDCVDTATMFANELSQDIQKAKALATNLVKTVWAVLRIAIASANKRIDEFVEERTDKTITTKEVSWHEAVTAALFSDFVYPLLNAWLIANIWESAFWIDINRRF